MELNISCDHRLSKIKCEFEEEEEETKIQYGVFENKSFDKSSTELQSSYCDFRDGLVKTEPTMTDMFSEDIKIDYGEAKRETIGKNEEFINTLSDHDLSNIKCEFEEEETNIQYGVLEDELPEEKVTKYSSLTDITTLHTLDSELSENSIIIHKQTLNTNVTIHTREKPYKCDTCGQCFRRLYHLRAHMKIHTGEKPYKCETCGHCFSRIYHLNIHMTTHTGKKPYKCETCGQCFGLKQRLSTHMRIHTGEKPYKCEACGKCFNDNTNLKKHMRIHTGEKPYICETCGQCFIRMHYLRRHMKIHTGEKPYKCETCAKCFNDKGNLNKHMRIHKGGKPYNT